MALFESLRREVRQSVRGLVREKSFTLTVLTIVALCLGANVAIFAVVNGLLLKPLPFRDPHELVLVANAYPKAGVERAGSSVPHYLERKEGVEAFASAAAMRGSSVTIGETGSPERVESLTVTPSFFPVLGVSAAMGRTFTDEEGNYGRHEVVVISDGLWRQRFGSDPAIIGRTLRINTTPHTIVGVMPAKFRYLSSKARLWTPLCFDDNDRKPDRRHGNNMEMIARLRPGQSVTEAQAQVEALNASVMKQDPYARLVQDAGFRTGIHDLGKDFVAKLRPVLLLLQAGVVFLLVIGAVNLANLLLVRATGRAKEQSVRQALGASRVQLARALVIETVLLTVAGGVIGLALGAAALRGLAVVAVDQLPMEIKGAIDAPVVAMALGASVVLGLVLSLPVMWHSLRGDLTAALAVESRGGTTTRSVHRLRHTLIVTQIALAFVLLAGTGLLGLSFSKVLAVKPGFAPENVLTAEISLPWLNYKDEAPRLAFVEKLATEVSALPGVTAVGASSGLPFSGSSDNNAISIEGRPLAEGESLQAHLTSGVAGDYFKAMGIPLREGRFITSDDSHGDAKVCVVDEDTARRYWPKGDAIGHRLINGPPGAPDAYFTIVGVVGSVKQNDLADTRTMGAVYFPYRHYASLGFSIVVRTTQAPELAGTGLREAVRRTDPELALHNMKTMSARLDESLASRRIPLLLAGVFAIVAVILSAVGIYGVLAYTVVQRQREIGVRMALGAQPEQILRQFMALGGQLLVVALPLGLLGAWLAGRAMTGLLYGVGPANALVFGSTALVLGAVALSACFLPSRRAARVEPIEALRGN